MTFNNSINKVATLAHELGHVFHSGVIWDLPSLGREYAMNVTETASTSAELIIAGATLREARSNVKKINLLDTKIQDAVAIFMDIHACFIFENNFYQAHQKGLVVKEDITELVLVTQEESYRDSLDGYHPYFWASKLHFFIDDVPLYNFPYTFGCLFSMGIYAYANQQSSFFEDQYTALLRDTTSMTSEGLTERHLNTDLIKSDFWQASIDQVLRGVEQPMTPAENYVD